MASTSVQLKAGEKCATGSEVLVILGQNSKITVFTTTDNQLRWQYHENGGNIPEAQMPIVHDFDSLMAEIKLRVPKHNRRDIFERLGKALFAAVTSDIGGEANKYYDPIRAIISQATDQHSRFIYTVFALVAAVPAIAALILIGHYWFSQQFIYFVGAAFGAAGAAISVMHRMKSITQEASLSDGFVYLHSGIRILLGMTFGALFVYAAKANLILGALNNDDRALGVFALVAGFSERLMPDLLERLETQAKGNEPETH
jgi:hypothetical protein